MIIVPFPGLRVGAEQRPDMSAPRLVHLVEPYHRYLIGESRRSEGIARYLWAYRRFVAWMPAHATVANVDGATLQDYKEYLANERHAAPATIINALSVQKDFARFAMSHGLRSDDPTAGVARPKRARPGPKPLYEHEIVALLEAIRVTPWLPPWRAWHWRRNERLIWLLLYSGLRLSEAAGLTWDDVQIAARVIVVPAAVAKGGKERIVTLHARLITILERVPEAERTGAVAGRKDGRCLTARGMAKIFNRWLQNELKLTKVHAHRLRHSFACLMLWHGADLKTIQELLGHAQLGTTEWYLEAREEDKQAAVDSIPDFGA